MTGTMTWVGMDVHARSTHAAAIDSMTGELVRRRFGPGVDEAVGWLQGLPGPVRACYEAGPTGFGLYRAAISAGVAIDVIAPGKTPRGRSDRVKTDRKDAELLARCLLAGSLTRVVVPPPEVAPAFVATAISTGTHTIEFRYRGFTGYPLLFALCGLTLAAILGAQAIQDRHAKTTMAYPDR